MKTQNWNISSFTDTYLESDERDQSTNQLPLNLVGDMMKG